MKIIKTRVEIVEAIIRLEQTETDEGYELEHCLSTLLKDPDGNSPIHGKGFFPEAIAWLEGRPSVINNLI